jgi:hypothetical protein
MANGWNPLIGIGFTALGVGYLWEAYRRDKILPPTPMGRLGMPFGLSADGLRPNLPYASLEGRSRLSGLGYSTDAKPYGPGGSYTVKDTRGKDILHVPVGDGVRTIKFYPAGDINNRLRFIIDQMKKDAKDPKTVTEATQILSGKCPVANGGLKWCVPVKDWDSEVRMLFYAITNPNSPFSIRYVRDPVEYDGFRSSDLMRRIPAGDCDDFTIRLGAWLMSVGYNVKCRIVSPRGQPGAWAHIYLMVGTPPGENTKWRPLDPTEAQNGPFWEVPNSMISARKDFEV